MVPPLQRAPPASLLASVGLSFSDSSCCGGFKLAPQREVTTISNFTHTWRSPWRSNAEHGTAREKAGFSLPFRGWLTLTLIHNYKTRTRSQVHSFIFKPCATCTENPTPPPPFLHVQLEHLQGAADCSVCVSWQLLFLCLFLLFIKFGLSKVEIASCLTEWSELKQRKKVFDSSPET